MFKIQNHPFKKKPVAARIFFIMFLCNTLSMPAQSASAPVIFKITGDTDMVTMQKEILYYVNQHRKSMGLNGLVLITEATAQALQHSTDMADGKTAFGHDGFDERIDNISKKTGLCTASAENVARGQLTAKEMVDMWLKSPGHKRNIEGNYTLTGIGAFRSADGEIFCTQIFLYK